MFESKGSWRPAHKLSRCLACGCADGAYFCLAGAHGFLWERDPLLHALCFKQEMLSHQLPCLLPTALIFLILVGHHSCLSLSNTSKTCPRRTFGQCILPTCQYLQSAHVFLILPTWLDVVHAPFKKHYQHGYCCCLHLLGVGQGFTNTAVDGYSQPASALGSWRM